MVTEGKDEAKARVCGIIMPISECDGMSQSHWADVLGIIRSAASEAKFEARLVSDTFESNLIHKEILRNVYDDPIVICDVSGRNPNVFFELGIRMATQKPTVIIKDDHTNYPFDTSPNRYIEYPRDLRHPAMEKFKRDLIQALNRTIDQDQSASFIGQLGPFQVPRIESQEAPLSEIILNRLERIEAQLRLARNNRSRSILKMSSSIYPDGSMTLDSISNDYAEFTFIGYTKDMVEAGIKEAREKNWISFAHGNSVKMLESDGGKIVLRLQITKIIPPDMVRAFFHAVDDTPPF